MSVFKAIHNVQSALAQDGITKGQTNTFDKYQFRGIDDVYNALANHLKDHKLVVIPQVLNFDSNSVLTSQGKPTIQTFVNVKYLLVSVEGDSSSSVDQTECVVVGEACDRGDKGMNKAMSSAYKLMCFQMFCIPTESSGNDVENESVELAQKFVGPTDMKVMIDLMGQSNTDLSAFLEWQQLEKLDLMPLERFAAAVNALQRKIDRMAQEYAGEQAATNQSMNS